MKTLSVVVLAAALTGCHGQNPFKRGSDPIKDYPRTAESSTIPYVPGQKPAPAPAAPATGPGQETGAVKDQPTPCFQALSAVAEPDHGNLLLKFDPEVESTYAIKVTVGGPHQMDVDIQAEKPEGSDFRLMSRQGNTFFYDFTWKPGKDNTDAKFAVVNNSPVPEGACPGNKSKISFNLSVGGSKIAAPAVSQKDAPKVTFPKVKNPIIFGDKLEFKIVIEDPKATADKAPDIYSVDFFRAADNVIFLDGSKAVITCEDPGRALGGKKYEFNCVFDSNLVEGVERYLNSGREMGAAFHVTAVSSASGAESAPTLQRIDVVFEKVAPVKGVKP